MSTLELLELRTSGALDDLRQQHVEGCQRCSLLLELLPANAAERAAEFAEGWEPSDDLTAAASVAAETASERDREIGTLGTQGTDQRTRTGDLWLVPVDDNHNEVVAVVGQRRDAADLVWIAPLAVETEMAAAGDVVVDEKALGYGAMLCVWDSGAIKTDQLETYRGRLASDDRLALAEAFKAFLGSESLAAPAGRAPIVGQDDPRLAWRAGFQDRLRALFAVADRELEGEVLDDGAVEEAGLAHPPATDEAGRGTRVRTPTKTKTKLFSVYLAEQMDEAGWDEVGLAEKAHLETVQIRAFLQDKFELTTQSDTPSLAAVIRTIVAEDQDTDLVLEGPVRCSLQQSKGGMLTATRGHGVAIAASSFAVVDEEKRNADLHKGLTEIDDSVPGQAGAVETYIAAVRALLV